MGRMGKIKEKNEGVEWRKGENGGREENKWSKRKFKRKGESHDKG